MKTILLALLTLLRVVSSGQSCNAVLQGHVQRFDTKESLAGTTVFVKEINFTAVSDSNGNCAIANLCAGAYALRLSHAGYDTLTAIVQVYENGTSHDFLLFPRSKSLSEVSVSGERKQDIATNALVEIKGHQLFQASGQTLGETLKNIPGLNSIQTGPSISKPVIHGLHSNRVLILNNGVRQEGQQWGTEHAPEIDPFVASKISIIKGAASVRYGSDAIVGVILVEPKTLNPEKALGGEANLVAGSNGRVGAASAYLEGRLKGKMTGFNWRAQGTLKRGGNFKTADYFLTNTGLAEQDFSVAANYKNKRKNFVADVYYSRFHNKLGIFEGSHVGNITDLYAAFIRPKPITPSYFTYDIARTYQDINHNLLKISSGYKLKYAGNIEVVYAYQQNKRDEYDIDLPYSNDPGILKMPQISFQIKTHTIDLLYHQQPKNNLTGSFGVTGITQGNVFKGIRYLVPNFRNYSGGAFGIERYSKNNFTVEAGARFDYRWLRVYRLNNTTLQTYSNTHTYKNFTGTIGSSYRFSNMFSISGNVGSAWRAPSVNELYIDGIHLSAASYEKGDSSLASERSYNFTFSTKYESEKFVAELAAYNNIINNFIYAKPTLKPITLISGTYPFFQYTAADVNLKGFDLELQYRPFTPLSINSKTSIVRGWNKSIHDYLIFMPADRFDNSVKYEIAKWHSLQHWYISIENITVLTQTRVPPNSDYVKPPKGYSIFNVNTGFEFPCKGKRIFIELAVYNVTNQSYRDYLNKYRYYADDLGINAVLRTKINF